MVHALGESLATADSEKPLSAMNSLLHDNLAGVRQIKAYAREEAEHRRFNQVSARLKDATLVVLKAWAIYTPSMEFVNLMWDFAIVNRFRWHGRAGRKDGSW